MAGGAVVAGGVHTVVGGAVEAGSVHVDCGCVVAAAVDGAVAAGAVVAGTVVVARRSDTSWTTPCVEAERPSFAAAVETSKLGECDPEACVVASSTGSASSVTSRQTSTRG